MPRPTAALSGVVLVVGALAPRGAGAVHDRRPGPAGVHRRSAGRCPPPTTHRRRDPAATDVGATADRPGTAGDRAVPGAGLDRRENQKPGTTDWHIPDDRADVGQDQRLRRHHQRRLRRDLHPPGVDQGPVLEVSAYRIGYYGGTGGRLIWRSRRPARGRPAGPHHRCPHRAARGRRGSRPSPSPPTPTGRPGQYLLRLESSDGGATFVPMVIRDDGSHSDLLVQSAVTTWQAYNGWGGASLYTGTKGRADVVSFDRPYTGNGSGEFLGREFEFICMVERLGPRRVVLDRRRPRPAG